MTLYPFSLPLFRSNHTPVLVLLPGCSTSSPTATSSPITMGPGKLEISVLEPETRTHFSPSTCRQAAYDDLAAHVEPHEPSTQTYYFGIPLDYAHDLDATTSMFAFEVYGRREVRLPCP